MRYVLLTLAACTAIRAAPIARAQTEPTDTTDDGDSGVLSILETSNLVPRYEQATGEPTDALNGILAFLDVNGAEGQGVSRREETTSDGTTEDESDSGLLSILDTSNLVPRYEQATGEPTDALNGVLAFLDVDGAEGQGVSRREEETTETEGDSGVLDILDLDDILGDD